MVTRRLVAALASLAATVALATGTAQAQSAGSQNAVAGYAESGARQIWMGFQMPKVSCRGADENHSVSIGITGRPVSESANTRFHLYARAVCVKGSPSYLLYTEAARGDHQHLGFEMGLQPGDWVSIRLRQFAHHLKWTIAQRPDGNGNDLEGHLTATAPYHLSQLLLGTVSSAATMPKFSAFTTHSTVNDGHSLSTVHPHRYNAHRGSAMLVHTTYFRSSGRAFAMNFVRR